MRRPSLLTVAIVIGIALLVGTILLLVLAGTARAPQADGSANSSAPPEPTEAAGAGPLDPGSVPWLYTVGPQNGQPRSFNLQAGTLGEPAPIIDIEVPWTVDPMAEPARRPAAAQAADGSVLYVADDGASSVVHRLTLDAEAPPATVGELADVVWSIAVTRDGDHAYLALAARGDPNRHTGVVRLALDGSGETELVMPEAVAEAVRLVAVSSLVEVRLSADDRQLIRQLCTGARGCEHDLLDIGSGRTLELGPTPPISVAGDAALIDRCGPVECTKELVDLQTGAGVPLVGVIFEAQLVSVDGRTLVAFVDGDPMGADSTIALIDVATGDRELLYQPDPPGPVMLAVFQVPLVITVPSSHLLASVGTGEDGAIVAFTNVAIPLTGGPAVELPPPPLRHEVLPGAQG